MSYISVTDLVETAPLHKAVGIGLVQTTSNPSRSTSERKRWFPAMMRENAPDAEDS